MGEFDCGYLLRSVDHGNEREPVYLAGDGDRTDDARKAKRFESLDEATRSMPQLLGRWRPVQFGNAEA